MKKIFATIQSYAIKIVEHVNVWLLYGLICVALIVSVSVENARIRDMRERVDECSKALDQAQEELQSQIEDLREGISDLGQDIEKVRTQIEAIAGIEPALLYSDEEIDLIALCTLGEAEGEPEIGKRLVIDTILNRVDGYGFPNTIREVIYAPSQFACMTNGRVDHLVVDDATRALVIEELNNRTDHQVLYFRTEYYHDFGTPLYKVGNHYFSTR